jgi:hypothetical protein
LILHLLWRSLRLALSRSGLLSATVLFCSVSSIPIWVLTRALKVGGDSFTCNALAVFTSDGCKKVSRYSIKRRVVDDGLGRTKGKTERNR